MLADAQTAGRGRQGETLGVAAGQPLPLRAPAAVAGAPLGLLPLAAGVAVAKALAAEGVDGAAQVAERRASWAERKVGGILAEATSGADGLESVVVGIGVNVGSARAAAPDVRGPRRCAERAGARGGPRGRGGRGPGPTGRLVSCPSAEGPARVVHAAWRGARCRGGGAPSRRPAGDGLRGIARDLDDGGALVLELEDGPGACFVRARCARCGPRAATDRDRR